jgi:alkylation response protein AidB-like acyl-CoA dehydrogenase
MAQDDLEAFRQDVRAFLDAELTDELRVAGRNQVGVFSPASVGRKWHRILFEKGWITPTWPAAFGGIGWSARQKYIFEQECALAEAPTLSAQGLMMCGPILIHYGTEDQQKRFIPPLRSGEDYWCQGYSEVGAGSDLAALSCRARRDGDDYIVNGSKMWTTHAHHADWMFMLVRTGGGDRPQQGMSFLLAGMRTPGIKVEPIISMSGEHEVNQVFFDDVRIPFANRIGEEGQGWDICKRLLEFERSGVYGPRSRRLLRKAERLAKANGLWTDDDFRLEFADLSIQIDVLEAGELRLLMADSSTSGISASLLKLAGTETLQRASELCVAAAGQSAAFAGEAAEIDAVVAEGARATARYLNLRAATIYGGSSEVQRNILARTALGL